MSGLRAGVLLVLAVAVLTVALDRSAPATESTPPPGWVAERVDAPRSFGLDAHALALDSSGVPHVAYGGDRLYLATRIDGAWVTRVVADDAGVGGSASLALDAFDNAHIAHLDAGSDRILYSTDASGAWTTEVVATVDRAAHVALRLDAAGGAHVAFLDGAAGTLQYAANGASGWTVETLDETGAVAGEVSIDVDTSGHAHVAYETLTGTIQSSLQLRYATNETGSWESETVVESSPFAPEAGGHDIAVDDAGDVHIVYDGSAAGFGIDRELRYATNGGGRWTSEVLDGLGSAGIGASLHLDESGDLHVTYLNSGSVAYLTTAGGVSIRLLGPGEGHTSVALDADGNAHVVHGGTSGRDLRYLRPDRGGWIEEEVDASATAGISPALALDPAGGAHLLHRAGSRLIYQTNVGGNWTREVLLDLLDGEPDAEAGHLFVDAAGSVHVTYFGGGFSADRVYATRPQGGAWETEVVANFSRAGFSRIAFDALGGVHLLFPGVDGSYAIATRVAEGWTTVGVDHRSAYPLEDFDVDPAGLPHLLGRDATSGHILHTTRSAGVWIDEVVDVGATSGAVNLDVDDAGDVHIVFMDTDGLRYATNGSGSWVTERIARAAAGEAGDLVVDTAGTVHATYRDPATGAVNYARRSADGWARFTVDAGAATGALALGAERFTTSEGRDDLWIPVMRQGRASLAATTTSLAIDALGGLHVAYDDAALGDLKYASPGSARGLSATLSAVDGTATPGTDFIVDGGTIGWTPQDTGAKYVHITASEDDELEAEETIGLELTTPAGTTVVGAPSRAVVRILDAAAAPAEVPDDAVRSFLHLTSVTVAGGLESERVVVRGLLDTGPEALALGDTATVTANSSTLTLERSSTRRGVVRYGSRGASLVLSASRRGSSRSRLVFSLAGEPAVFPDGEFTIRVQCGLVDASGSVAAGLDGYRRARPRRGRLLAPGLQLTSCRGRVRGGGRDTLALTAVLPDLGAAPDELSDVTVRFGNRFSAIVAGEEFGGRKQVRAYRGPRGGVTSLVIDYRRGVVRLRAVGVDLGPFVPGSQPVLFAIDVGTERSLLVRLAHLRRALVY